MTLLVARHTGVLSRLQEKVAEQQNAMSANQQRLVWNGVQLQVGIGHPLIHMMPVAVAQTPCALVAWHSGTYAHCTCLHTFILSAACAHASLAESQKVERVWGNGWGHCAAGASNR